MRQAVRTKRPKKVVLVRTAVDRVERVDCSRYSGAYLKAIRATRENAKGEPRR